MCKDVDIKWCEIMCKDVEIMCSEVYHILSYCTDEFVAENHV
jgi:hypothetical protein